MIRHAVTTVADNFANNIIAACARMAGDWDDICAIFFPGNQPIELRKITPTGSDFHKGGQLVLILTFNTSATLVYKPADVELDYRLIGDTTAVGEKRLEGGRSLSELINDRLPDDDKLPTYRILPRNPGSTLKKGPNGRLPIESSYGYIEFLTHLPATLAGWRRDRASDWVTADETNIKRFYRQWGGLLAMASLYSISDLHVENAIAHGCRPHLIDLEVSFTGPITGIGGTYALQSGSGALAGEGVGEGRRVRFNDRTANLEVGDAGAELGKSPTINRLWHSKDGGSPRLVEPREWVAQIWGGFDTIIGACRQQLPALLTWLNDESVKNTIARFIPYSTGEFKNRLRLLYSPQYCSYLVPVNEHDFARLPFIAWTKSAEDASRERDSNIDGEALATQWPSPRPNHAIQTAEHAFADYLKCDVPSYYHRLASRDLLNARGELVAVRMDLTPDNRQTYFPRSTWGIVKDQITDLGDETRLQARRAAALKQLCAALTVGDGKYVELAWSLLS
jgi:hypothetical protein